MNIKNIHLNSFGKFNDFKLDLSPNLNVVYGENEAGKSTINHFILAMFAEEQSHEQYERFCPWENQGHFSGKILIDLDGKDLDIEKDFLKSEQSALYRYGKENEEMHHLGFTLPVTTLATYKLSNFVGKHLIADLKQKLMNKTVTNSENINIESVFDSLKKEKTSEALEGYLKTLDTKKDEVEFIETQMQEPFEELKLLYAHEKNLSIKHQQVKSSLERIKETITGEEEKLNTEAKLLVEEIDNKIFEKELEAKSLHQYVGVEMSEYEAYLELKSKKDRALMKIKSLEAQTGKLNSELGSDQIALLKGHRFLTDETYVKNFESDIEQYKKLKMSLDDLNDEINTRKEKLYDAYEINDRYEDATVLEKDYQKLLVLAEKERSKSNNGFDENQLVSSKHKRIILSVMAAIFALSGIGLLIFSNFVTENLYTVLSLDIGIVCLLAAVYLGYKIYKVQTVISQLEYVRLYNKKHARYKASSEANISTAISRILDKYNCSDFEELETLFVQSREAELTKSVANKEISILDAKYMGYNNQIALIKRRIEHRMLQCEFESDIGESPIEQIEQEFRDMLDNFRNMHLAAKELEEADTTIKAQENIVKDLTMQLEAGSYTMFKDHTYSDIYDYKQRHLTLLNDIEILKLKKESLLSGEKASEEYKQLLADKNQLMEQDLETMLVIRTLHSQIFDTEKLLRRYKEKKRKLLQEISKEADVKEQIKILDKIQQLLTANIENLKQSIFPKVNRKMNQLLYEVTGKYDKIHISDDGDVKLTEPGGQEIDLEHLSLGTIDQIYFIIGISMIEEYYDEYESIPLILDDAFVQYDDDRFANVMKVVSKLNRQVILFTCYEREQEYLEENNIDYNYVELVGFDEVMEDEYV